MIETAIQIRKLLDPLYKICDRIDIREYGHTPENKTDTARFILTRELFDFLKYLSAADGDISQNEIDFICSFLGIRDSAAITENIFKTVGTVELSMSTVPPLFIKICKYEPDKAEAVIRFFDALGRQFTAADGHSDPLEQKRLDSYIGKLRDYKANTMSAERKDFAEASNGKQAEGINNKNNEERHIDLDLPFDKSVYAITNILKEPEEVREFLAYRISFIGQSLAQDGSWQDSHIVVSAAHRCIYVRPVDTAHYQVPFYEYLGFDEEKYVFTDYSRQLFSPDVMSESGDWFEIRGNAFAFRAKERHNINGLYYAMVLSDHYYRRKEQMYTPAKIGGDIFVMNVDAKQRYGIHNEFILEKTYVLSNVVFRIYDEYMDTLANGYLAGAHYYLSFFTEHDNVAEEDPLVSKGGGGPRIVWNDGFAYDLRYRKTERLNPSFHFFMIFDNTSELRCDLEKLTLYHTMHSHGQRCVELKFPDERQLYAFGEWISELYGWLDIEKNRHKADSDIISVLDMKKKNTLREYGESADKITREKLIEAGLDEERLSYYEKAYMIAKDIFMGFIILIHSGLSGVIRNFKEAALTGNINRMWRQSVFRMLHI